MADRTIIYYTANQEDPVFEQKVIDHLLENAGDIPIVSVSRKPMDLGHNICVGEVPISYTSEWKQLLLGLKAAETKYCIAAESDCLYPPGYFHSAPVEDRMIFNYTNIWIVWKRHPYFYEKTGYCEGAQICDREYWIERLEPLLPEKWEPYTREEENKLVLKIFPERKEWTGPPVISFKTGNGVSVRTTYKKGTVRDLQPWGEIRQIKERMFG